MNPTATTLDNPTRRTRCARQGVSWLMRNPSTGDMEVTLSARFHRCRAGRSPAGLQPVGGLRMRHEPQPFEHRPVMVDEIVDALAPVPPGVAFDATAGGGGHSEALLRAHDHLRVVAVDRDPAAVAAATARLAPFGERAAVVSARFDALDGVLARQGVAWLSAALFDLGVSSPQFDRPERGFSYRAAGPLDMRMDPAASLSAADVVNSYDEDRLGRLFAEHGEGRFGRRIAKAVVAARPISDTVELAEIVKAAIPAAARRTGGHPAKRVFQAIRVEVNAELDVLAPALDDALARLAPGGRAAVLSYHSGEDRIVKDRFRFAATGGCTCPPALPCGCGAVPTHRLVFRGSRTPTREEIATNPRAESARLRVVERLGDESEGRA